MTKTAIHVCIEHPPTSPERNIKSCHSPFEVIRKKPTSIKNVDMTNSLSEKIHSSQTKLVIQQISCIAQQTTKDAIQPQICNKLDENVPVDIDKGKYSNTGSKSSRIIDRVEFSKVHNGHGKEAMIDKVDDDHVGNEGDEHFLDDFDVNKKDEILSQFWVDLWPKLEEMGWSLIRNDTIPSDSKVTFVPSNNDGKEPNNFKYRTISEVVSHEALGAVPELKHILKRFDELKSLEHKTLDWKNSRTCYPKKTSLVGPLHQVSRLPEAKKTWPRSDDEDKNYVQYWDYRRAEENEVFGYLDSVSVEQREFALNALHKNDYIISGTNDHIDQSMKKYSRCWNPKEKKKFATAIWNYRKNMRVAVHSTGRSYNDCLWYYLNEYKSSDEYKQLKEMRVAERAKLKAESELHHETCRVCDDGGSLLICEKCEAGYHLQCLLPPLKEVPSGVWFCPVCCENLLSSLKRELVTKDEMVSTKRPKNNGTQDINNGSEVTLDGLTRENSHKDLDLIERSTVSFADEICEILMSSSKA